MLKVVIFRILLDETIVNICFFAPFIVPGNQSTVWNIRKQKQFIYKQFKAEITKLGTAQPQPKVVGSYIKSVYFLQENSSPYTIHKKKTQ